MPTIDAMTLDEIETTLSALRERRNTLKATNQVAQRKIVRLAQRRERLMQQVNALDEEISQLRGEPVRPQPPAASQSPVTSSPRTRRRHAAPATGPDTILACVQRHGSVPRATIVAECQLTPAKATAALRRLCQAGTLVRHGEKSQTTYSMP